MSAGRPALAAACVAALAAPVAAQLRPAPHPRCVVTAHAAVALDDALDPSAPPAVLALDAVTVVAWRDRVGALRAQRFAADLRALEAPVALAQPVQRFAMARTPTGLVLAYVERGRDLVVARRSAAFEAQNVPRVVRAIPAPVTALALAATPGGALLAWASASGVQVLPLDARGVPRGPAVVVHEQSGVRGLGLDGGDPVTLRVDASDPAVEPWVLTLGDDGAALGRARWPVGALGPVRMGGASLTAQITPLGSPMLLRSSPVAPAALADPAVAPRARLDALAVDRDLAVALITDVDAGRQALARLMPDGSATWLAAVRGALPGPATFAVQAPGTLVLLTRDAAHVPVRTTLQRYGCTLP